MVLILSKARKANYKMLTLGFLSSFSISKPDPKRIYFYGWDGFTPKNKDKPLMLLSVKEKGTHCALGVGLGLRTSGCRDEAKIRLDGAWCSSLT